MPAARQAVLASETTRKPLGHAAQSQSTDILLRSNSRREGLAPKLSQVIDSPVLFWGAVRNEEIRDKVRSQVRRLRRDKKRRYDPRHVSRIISKRLHIPQLAVDEILQGSIPEFEEWRDEIRAGIARAFAAADAKAAAVWERKSA